MWCRPTAFRAANARRFCSFAGTDRMRSTKATFSRIVLRFRSLKSWKTTPIDRRSSGIWRSGIAVTLRPPTRICPCDGSSSRNTSFRKVVFPAPEGPVRKQNSPFPMCSVTSESAEDSRSYCL